MNRATWWGIVQATAKKTCSLQQSQALGMVWRIVLDTSKGTEVLRKPCVDMQVSTQVNGFKTQSKARQKFAALYTSRQHCTINAPSCMVGLPNITQLQVMSNKTLFIVFFESSAQPALISQGPQGWFVKK